MENAIKALEMAGAVLIFVLAISIIILSFGQVRESADTILDYKDRETVYIEGNYYYEHTEKERVVGLETVIPSIFRAYLENYKIVFVKADGKPLYKRSDTGDEKYSLDLEDDRKNVTLASNEQKAEFLCGILYRKFKSSEDDFKKTFKITFTSTKSLYEQLNEAETITEFLGEYYQNDSENIQDVNKTPKRIITYKLSN